MTQNPPDRMATDAAINTDPDENRALAGHMLSVLQCTQSTITETIVSISKWVLTSLLAINGAAGIATWQISMSPAFKIAACALFLMGVLTTLLSGHLQVKGSGKALAKLGELIGYWATVHIDGLRASELETFSDLESATKAAGRVPEVLGWVAVILFVGGAIVAGAGAIYAGVNVTSGQ